MNMQLSTAAIVAVMACWLLVANAEVVQVGNTFPKGMSVGGTSTVCDAASADPEVALVRYNNASKGLEVCDASSEQWIPASSPNSSVLSVSALVTTLGMVDGAELRNVVFCSAAGEYSIASHSCSCYEHNDGEFCEQCLSGWTTPPNSNECSMDVDECDTGAHTCDPNAHCSNNDGSFSCTCATGFEGDGETCSDIDACAIANGTGCNDAPGVGCFDLPAPSLGYECRCVPGFEGDGVSCSACDEGYASNGTACQYGYAQSCYIDKTVVNVGNSPSGVKTLHPTSDLDYAIDVYCDQVTDGGGWQLFGVVTEGVFPWEFWRGSGIPGTTIQDYSSLVNHWSFDVLKDLWTPNEPERSQVSVSIVVQHASQAQTYLAETQTTDKMCWTDGVAQFPSRDLLVLENSELLQAPYQGNLGILHKCKHTTADWERTLNYVTDNSNAFNQYDDNYSTAYQYALYHWNAEPTFFYRPMYTYCGCGEDEAPLYQGIFWVREEVNECLLGTHHCDANANCIDTAGSYECECTTGYVGDGRTCTDYDACSTDPCSPNAACTDLPAPSLSANCTCNAGYEGNGLTCSQCAVGSASSGTGDACDSGYAQSCNVLKSILNPAETSGIKSVYPTSDKTAPISVYCDMGTQGGGWMLFGVMVEGTYPWDFFSGVDTPATSIESFANRRTWSWGVDALFQHPSFSALDVATTVQHSSFTQSLTAETAASDKNCWTFGIMEFPSRDLLVLQQSVLQNSPYQGNLGIQWKCRHATGFERTLDYVEVHSNAYNQYTDSMNSYYTYDVWHWNAGPSVYYRPNYSFAHLSKVSFGCGSTCRSNAYGCDLKQ